MYFFTIGVKTKLLLEARPYISVPGGRLYGLALDEVPISEYSRHTYKTSQIYFEQLYNTTYIRKLIAELVTIKVWDKW